MRPRLFVRWKGKWMCLAYQYGNQRYNRQDEYDSAADEIDLLTIHWNRPFLFRKYFVI